MAAVIGREFPVELLGGLMSGQDGLERILDTLVSQGLVHPIGPLSQLRYRFKHSLTQMVAYDALPRPQREALHERVGSLLESRHARRLEPFYEGLAYHFAHSANLDKALHYLECAGAKSAGYFALEDARQHYRIAVQLLAGREVRALDRQRRIAFTLRWADVSFYAATPELLQALQAAGDDAAAIVDEGAAARVHFALGQMCYVWAKFAEALREFKICETSGQGDLRARSRLYIGRCCYYNAEFALGRRYLRESMAARLAQDDPADAGYGGLMLASIHGWRGRFAAAEAAFGEALALAARLVDPSLKSATLNMRSIVRALGGEFAAALADGSTAAEVARRIDNVYIAAYARIASGYAHFMLGDQHKGLGLMEDGVAAATSGGGQGMPVLIAWHAEALALSGRLEEARRRADYAEQSALLSGQRVARPILLRTRALLARATERTHGARAAGLIEESIEEARRSGARPDAAIGRYRLAELLCSQGNAAGADQARAVARTFGALGMAWWRNEALRLALRAAPK
jgi:tetratricopeptide (TPR) repeat protein